MQFSMILRKALLCKFKTYLPISMGYLTWQLISRTAFYLEQLLWLVLKANIFGEKLHFLFKETDHNFERSIFKAVPILRKTYISGNSAMDTLTVFVLYSFEVQNFLRCWRWIRPQIDVHKININSVSIKSFLSIHFRFRVVSVPVSKTKYL